MRVEIEQFRVSEKASQRCAHEADIGEKVEGRAFQVERAVRAKPLWQEGT